MNQAITPTSRQPRQAYRDNFARHLMGVSLHMQARIMETLTRERGHEGLRINYEPYFTMASRGGVRLSDIADNLAISRQAANQVANQIEAAGYLERKADERDGRAKLLVLTRSGEMVVEDGAREVQRLDAQMRELAGSQAINAAGASLLVLCHELGLLPDYQQALSEDTALLGLLPRLASYMNNELMELTRAKGHPELKPNFGQVLTGIGPDGGRIQVIARSQNISKQAISTIVARLEEVGYLQRSVDPIDARQQVLQFTPYGEQLISDAVDSEAELRTRLAGIIGDDHLNHLQTTFARLYRALRLEGELFDEAPSDIASIASDLIERLGAEGARALAGEIKRITEEERTET